MKEKAENILLSRLEGLQTYLDMASIPFNILEVCENRELVEVSRADEDSFFMTEKVGKIGKDNTCKSCVITVYHGEGHEDGISIFYEEQENRDYQASDVHEFKWFHTTSKVVARYSKKNDTSLALERKLDIFQVQYVEGDEIPEKVCEEKIMVDIPVEVVNFAAPLKKQTTKSLTISL